jgi:tetratricopeptide (TPR) repeat protein
MMMTDSTSPPPPEPPDGDPPAHSDPDSTAEKLVINSPAEAKTLKDFLLWGAVILLAVFPAYTAALHGRFIWDDDRHVEQNRNLKDFSGLVNIWTKFGLRHGGTPQYYPFTHTTYWIENQLFHPLQGPEPDTLPFHVTNVLLHIAAAILLWLVLRELKVPGAWVIAAIFAVHPIQVESVAWISERKNVLSGALFFGSMLAYLKGSGFGAQGSGNAEETRSSSSPSSPSSLNPEPRTLNPFTDPLYWLSFALFVLAILSKSVACSLPAVMLVIVWWKRGRLGRRDVIPTLPFFAIGIAMAVLTAWLERAEVGASGAEWHLSFGQRLLIAGRAVWFYVGKLFWPARLTFIYPRWDVRTSQAWQWMFPIAVVAVMVILFALRRRIGRGALAAWLIFVGVLLPALGFFNIYPMRYSFVADHFQYLAGPALIALVVAGLARLLRPLQRPGGALPVGYVLAGVAIVVLTILTALQARIYDGHVALWRDTVAKNPGAWMAQYNLGTALMIQAGALPPSESDTATRWLNEAATHFAAAVRLKPDHDRAFNNWAQVLTRLGKPAEALEKVHQALAIRRSFDALATQGQALFDLKRYDDAIASYNQAIAYADSVAQSDERVGKTREAGVYLLLGEALAAKGDADNALAMYTMATELRPELWQAHLARGKLLAAKAKTEKDPGVANMLRGDAALAFAHAGRLVPESPDPHIALAELMMDVGNLRGATAELYRADQIMPNNPVVRAAVGRLEPMVKAAAATRPTSTQSTMPSTRPASGPATQRAAQPPTTRAMRGAATSLTTTSSRPATAAASRPATRAAMGEAPARR